MVPCQVDYFEHLSLGSERQMRSQQGLATARAAGPRPVPPSHPPYHPSIMGCGWCAMLEMDGWYGFAARVEDLSLHGKVPMYPFLTRGPFLRPLERKPFVASPVSREGWREMRAKHRAALGQAWSAESRNSATQTPAVHVHSHAERIALTAINRAQIIPISQSARPSLGFRRHQHQSTGIIDEGA